MKKIILIASLTILSSCKNGANQNGVLESIISSNDTPKCDDEMVKNTIKAILKQNELNLTLQQGQYNDRLLAIDTAKVIIKNIMTSRKDDELKLCDCEATAQYAEIMNSNITYSVQKNSDGEIIVKVEDVSPFSR